MNELKETCDTLQEDHLDFMIRLACQYKETEEINELIGKSSREFTSDEKRLAADAYELFQKKLQQQEIYDRKRKRAVKAKRVFPRIVEVAACVVLALGIFAPIAVANISFIRIKVMELLVNLEADHANIEMVENEDATFDVPIEWKGRYYPSYIPNGYTLNRIRIDEMSVEFINEDGDILSFDECDSNTGANLDSEDALLSYDNINGQLAFIIERSDSTSIVWSNGSEFFIIEAGMPKEDLVIVAQGIRLIK